MTDTTWKWATLDEKGLELVQEAERTLGADVVLVYAEGGPRTDGRTREGLKPASLDLSALECLQGVEQRLGAVAVAYERG
jgi:hypothetical protein